MYKLKKIKNDPIKKSFFDTFVKVSTLIEYECPLLSHFIDKKTGKHWLYRWAELDKKHRKYNRWLIIPTTLEEIQRYISKKLSFYDLLISKEKVIKIDIDNDINYHNVFYTSVKDLPDSYLPDKDSYYSFDILYEEDFLDYYCK